MGCEKMQTVAVIVCIAALAFLCIHSIDSNAYGPYYGGGRYYYGGGSSVFFGFGFPFYGYYPSGYPYYYPYGYPYSYPYAYPYPYTYPYYSSTYDQPTMYIEPEQPSYWYYCQDPKGYYPYVTSCPSGWAKVTPAPPPPGEEGVAR
jgi:hypothetical protein